LPATQVEIDDACHAMKLRIVKEGLPRARFVMRGHENQP
jgi:hypothetical protein